MTTQQVTQTTRFGQVEYSTDDVVTFHDGLIGFSDLCSFVLIQHGEDSPFRWMQSVDNGEIAFLVVEPGQYVQGYEPEMPDSAIESLGLDDETARLVYTIVSIPPGKPEEMTLNLAGPIVINLETGIAQQIVLEDEIYSIKHKVFPNKESEESAA